MNRLYSADLTVVRADAKLFFDRPGDDLGFIGVVTEIEPKEDEIRVTMGLGDCGFHGVLLHKMDVAAGSISLPGGMAYSQAIIRGSSAGFSRARRKGRLEVACMLFNMRDRSNLTPQQTATSAYMASLALGGLLDMPREEIDNLSDPSDLVFGVPQMQQLNKKIGRRVIVDRE